MQSHLYQQFSFQGFNHRPHRSFLFVLACFCLDVFGKPGSSSKQELTQCTTMVCLLVGLVIVCLCVVCG